MHLIHYELIEVDGKKILKIDSLPSNKRVFLKENGQEEFYIRNGPSTIKLHGIFCRRRGSARGIF